MLKLSYFGSLDQKTINFIKIFLKEFLNFVNFELESTSKDEAWKRLNQEYRNLNNENANEIDARQLERARKQSGLDIQVFDLNDVLTESNVTELVNLEHSKTSDTLDLERTTGRANPSTQTENEQEASENNAEANIQTEKDEIVDRIDRIISEIDQPDLNLQVYRNCDDPEILRIYEQYLLKMKKFFVYYEEEDMWKVQADKKEYKSWSRDDGNFIVRKCEKKTEIDVELLQATMKNMKETPKWNPMLSIYLFTNIINLGLYTG